MAARRGSTMRVLVLRVVAGGNWCTIVKLGGAGGEFRSPAKQDSP